MLKNLILSVVVFASMLVNSTPAIAKAEEEKNSRLVNNYQIINLNTGTVTTSSFSSVPSSNQNYSSSYFPQSSRNERAFITDNPLMRVYNPVSVPFTPTVYIAIKDSQYNIVSTFTGFMVGPNTVVSAAHCFDLWFDNYNNITKYDVVVSPSKNGETYYQYGSAYATQLIVPKDVLDANTQNNGNDDWAILTITASLGNSSGWYGIRKPSTISFSGLEIFSSGYPDKGTVEEINSLIQNGSLSGVPMTQTDNDSNMFYSQGNIRLSYVNYFIGDWSALSGFSGGPIYYYDSISGYTIAGILEGGSNSHGSYNMFTHYTTGIKISNDVYNLLMTLI